MQVRQIRGEHLAPGHQICLDHLHPELGAEGAPASSTREFSLEEALQHLQGLERGEDLK